jgi:hypothetical protein
MSPAAITPPIPIGPVGQPDIQYLPDEIKYAARTKRRLATEDLPKTLPEGFPTKLDSDLVWDGKSLAESYDWNYHLSDKDLEEVEAALVHFKGNLSFFRWI